MMDVVVVVDTLMAMLVCEAQPSLAHLLQEHNLFICKCPVSIMVNNVTYNLGQVVCSIPDDVNFKLLDNLFY